MSASNGNLFGAVNKVEDVKIAMKVSDPDHVSHISSQPSQTCYDKTTKQDENEAGLSSPDQIEEALINEYQADQVYDYLKESKLPIIVMDGHEKSKEKIAHTFANTRERVKESIWQHQQASMTQRRNKFQDIDSSDLKFVQVTSSPFSNNKTILRMSKDGASKLNTQRLNEKPSSFGGKHHSVSLQALSGLDKLMGKPLNF